MENKAHSRGFPNWSTPAILKQVSAFHLIYTPKESPKSSFNESSHRQLLYSSVYCTCESKPDDNHLFKNVYFTNFIYKVLPYIYANFNTFGEDESY